MSDLKTFQDAVKVVNCASYGTAMINVMGVMLQEWCYKQLRIGNRTDRYKAGVLVKLFQNTMKELEFQRLKRHWPHICPTLTVAHCSAAWKNFGMTGESSPKVRVLLLCISLHLILLTSSQLSQRWTSIWNHPTTSIPVSKEGSIIHDLIRQPRFQTLAWEPFS